MQLFDKYLKKKIADYNKAKGFVSGGGGSAGALEPEPFQPINLDEYLKVPSTEEISQIQDTIQALEKDYEILTPTIETDYTLYKDYTKELDDLEVEIEEAVDDMKFFLNQKYNDIREKHNIVVERLQGNTKRQQEIIEEYNKLRPEYEKDIEIYNRWAKAQNEKPEEIDTVSIAQQLKNRTYISGMAEEIERGNSFAGIVATFGMTLTKVPKMIASTVLQAVQGEGETGASVIDKDWSDRVIDSARKDIEGFVKQAQSKYGNKSFMGLKISDLAELSQTTGYSLTSMAGFAVAAPLHTVPLPGFRWLAWGLGTLLSGKIAYNATKYQIVQQYLEFKDEESIADTGKGISQEEENELKKEFHSLANKYGFWEALPEAISNLTFLGLLTAPLSKMIGKNIAGKVLNKIVGMYGMEIGTEAWTQQVQASIEVEAGMREGDKRSLTSLKDWWTSLKEVAPQTFLLVTLMGGAGSAVVSGKQAFSKAEKSLKDEMGEEHRFYSKYLEAMKMQLEDLGFTSEEAEIEALAYRIEEEGGKEKVEPEVFKGKAYRGESRIPEHGADVIAKMKTAKEKLDYDYGTTGNQMFKEAEKVAEKEGIDLSGVAKEDMIWVTKKKDVAEKYGEVAEIKIPKDNIVLVKDKEEGYLVLKNVGKYMKVTPKAPTEPEIPKKEELKKVKEKVEPKEELNKVYDRLNELSPSDIGREGLGRYVLKFEGFTEECWQDAEREGKSIKDLEMEISKEWGKEERGKKVVDSGWQGEDIYYTIFEKEVTPKELELLAEEARKAKNVDEFVKNISESIRPIREAKVGELVTIQSPTYGEKSATQYNMGVPTQGEIVKINPKSVSVKVRDKVYKFPETAKVSALDLKELKGKDKQSITDFYNQAIVKPTKEKAKPLEEQLKEAQKEINRLKGIIKAIKGNKEKRQEFKKELVKYIKEYMPFSIQNKMLATVKNVTGAKGLEKAFQKIDQYVIEHYSKQYTKTIYSELKAKKIKPKRTKSAMLKGRFTPEIQDKLDFIRVNRNSSRAEALKKIQENIELFNKGEAINIAEENELLNMVGIKEMDLETLRTTLANIKSLKKEGRTLNAIEAEKAKARHEKDNIATIETLTGKEVKIDEESGKAILDSSHRTLPRTKEWGGILAGVRKFLDRANNWQFHLDSLLDKLSALDKTSKPFRSPLSKIGDRVHYARVNSIRSLEEALDMIQIKFVEAYGAVSKKDILKITQKLREEIDLGEFKNSEGSKVHFVLNKEQITKKVMQLDDPSLESTFKEGMLYTEEIENALRGALSEKDLAWIKGQREIYDYMWKRINPIFEKMYGIHFPYNPFYSGTIRRDVDLDIPEATLLSQDSMRFTSILNPSLKTRSKTKQSLQYDEATNSLMNYVMQMEHFINWAEPLQGLRSIFGDKRVKTVIREFYGQDILSKINGFLDDMTRDGVDKGKIIKWVDTIRFNFTRSILAKPHLGLKQIPSVLAYMTEMSVVDFVKGINNFWKSPLKNYRYLIEHSPYAKARFGEGFERDIHGAMKSDYYHVLAHSHKISDLMMGFVRAGDKLAVMQGMWTVMYAETKGQTTKAGVKKVEDAFVRGAIITDRTQPSFHTESMATGQRGGSLLKLFTMFQTQPNKYYQLIANNARNFKYGRGSRIKAASNIALAWAILPMIFQFIGDGGKWIERHQLRALILGGANHILVFGSMIRGMYGWLIKEAFDVQASPVFSTMREMEYCLAKIAKWTNPDKDLTPEDIQAFTEHFAKAVGQLTGLPTPYGVQVKKAIQLGDYRQLLFSEYILNLKDEEKKKKKPYVKSYGGDKYSKYLKSGYTKKSKYGKYLKKY